MLCVLVQFEVDHCRQMWNSFR